MKKTKSYRSLVAKINWHIKENSWANTTVDKWCVGVTDKPLRSKSDYQRELGMDVRNYALFYAYSRKTASQVKDHFISKGLSKATGLGDKYTRVQQIPFHKPKLKIESSL